MPLLSPQSVGTPSLPAACHSFPRGTVVLASTDTGLAGNYVALHKPRAAARYDERNTSLWRACPESR